MDSKIRRNSKFVFVIALLLAGVRGLFCPPTWAQDETVWDIIVGDFDNPANWTAGLPTSSRPGIFENTSAPLIANFVNNVSAGGFRVRNGADTTFSMGGFDYNMSSFAIVDQSTLEISNGRVITSSSFVLNSSELNVTDGAILNAFQFRGINGINTVNVVGSGSTVWVSDDTFFNGTINVDGGTFGLGDWDSIGYTGNGFANVTNGGQLGSGGSIVLTLGTHAGAHGELLVSGPGSNVLTENLRIGNVGNGIATFTNQAVANLGSLRVGGGNNQTGTGTMNVSGSGTTINVDGQIEVGNDTADGELNLSDSALLNHTGNTYMIVEGDFSSDNSTTLVNFLDVNDGSSFLLTNGSTFELTHVNGSATFNNGTGLAEFKSGTQFIANAILIGNIGSQGTVNVDGIGTEVETNFIRLGDNAGLGVLNVTGEATATANTLFSVRNGSQVIGVDGDIASPTLSIEDGTVKVRKINADSVLFQEGELNFFLLNGFTVPAQLEQSGGMLTAGDSPGRMIINGDFEISNGSIVTEIGGLVQDSEHDHFDWYGDWTILGGDLNVQLINNYLPSAGDQFDLFDFNSVSGSFSNVNLPDLGANCWDISQLYTLGTIRVVEPTLPDSFKLADGILVSGQLSDLFASDDLRFEIDPSPTKNLLKQRIDLIVQSTSLTMTPICFSFQLESSMSGGPSGDVIQTVELFNYVTNTRELVDTRAVADSDELVEIVPPGDLSRFVNQLNGEITAIVIWKSESFAGAQFTWSIDVDQAVWLATD